MVARRDDREDRCGAGLGARMERDDALTGLVRAHAMWERRGS